MPLDRGVWAGKRPEHWGKGPGRELSRAPPCGNVGSLATKPWFPAPQLPGLLVDPWDPGVLPSRSLNLSPSWSLLGPV